VGRFGLALLLTVGVVLTLRPKTEMASQAPDTDEGFRLLYELQFEQARARFLAWQETHPEDELGYAWLAASYLFQELYEQGVLTSEFFLDDERLLRRYTGPARHTSGECVSGGGYEGGGTCATAAQN